MNFTYRIVEDDGCFVAECLESDAQGEGKTQNAAVESLRSALSERMFRPDAIAPPDVDTTEPIHLSMAAPGAGRPEMDPSGPGEA